MSDRNDVVIINLDRPRELRYGHKALKTLLAMTGKDLESVDLNNLDLGELEKYLYCGLLSDARTNNETLTLEQMEDLLDQAPTWGELLEKMTEALQKAMGSLNNKTALDPNGQTPPKQIKNLKK